MPNKSPFDTPYTGRSGNNETGLFAYDIYIYICVCVCVTRKFKIGIHGENQMRYAYIEDVYYVLYEYTWSQRVMYTWTRFARNVSMIQLIRAPKRKYHFDDIFITGCTRSCLPVQSVIQILSK